jgi:hypothetical protein
MPPCSSVRSHDLPRKIKGTTTPRARVDQKPETRPGRGDYTFGEFGAAGKPLAARSESSSKPYPVNLVARERASRHPGDDHTRGYVPRDDRACSDHGTGADADPAEHHAC